MSHQLLAFLILCLLFTPRPSSTFSSNETDLRSLLAFKSAIEADPLGALSSWNETTDFCRWNGIQCSRRRNRVVAINLRSQGLLGSLSPHIGNLSLLKSITLQNNTFHGTIPQQITHLKRLRYVEFSNNSFYGRIPQNISNCRRLSYLNLINNELSGAIPIELGSMTELEALGLGKNGFSGHIIPPFLGNITSLTKLSFISGGFVGEIPTSFTRLRNLKFLQFAGNRLTGNIPPALFNLSALQYFGAPSNELDGTIPSSIGLTLPNLNAIDLFENRFSGPIPASFSNASLLERIQLYDNYFTGPMPRVGRLVHLRSFEFQRNLIADDIGFISSLTNSSKLVLLELGCNLLTGSLPESIANLSRNIRILNVEENRIRGKIPLGIGNIDKLADFLAGGNFLEGRIPGEIAKLYNMRRLFLEKNKFSNEVRFSFANMTFLSRVYLHGNHLSGNVPLSLANCTNLLELGLSHNNFHGFIHPEILNLSRMSIVLNLSYNALEGSIPNEVGSLKNLATLDLSNNKLSGGIPNSISKCISLEKLHLSGNHLEDEIPQGLSALVALHELDLSMNNLSGQIPILLGKLQLHRLDLSFNKLHGKVPIAGVFKNITSFSLKGNEGLCGGIPELRLPPCPSLESKIRNLTTLRKTLIPIMVVGGISLITIVFALLIYNYKQKMSKNKMAHSLPSLLAIQIMRLSYSDLLKATGGFSKANLLGFGQFGSVYKGVLDHDQTMVAVKVLQLSIRGASRSFLAECDALRNARHRNLLKILSVCESIDFQGNEFKALVYEFKSNGSLEKWLHQNAERRSSLNLIQRLNIAIDIARAVEYLHFGTDLLIVHGDLKPSNILLDKDMTACVGDFRLAKIVSDIVPLHGSNNSTGIRGTLGYVPPEYGMSCSVSMQGDVYSYGILLLEIFTNKRPTNHDSFKDNENLRSFVGEALPNHVMEVIDPLLPIGIDTSKEKIKKCMTYIMSIGMVCSNEMPRERMSMAEVANDLQMIQKFLCS